MTAVNLAATPPANPRRPEALLLGAVSAAHLISHFHILVLPVLFPFLKDSFGVGYVELGLALTLFNIVSGLTQAPMGFAVDRLGARRVLVAGLLLGGAAFASLGLVMTYPWLLVTAVAAGLANCVYHPADYAVLSAAMSEGRMGRAFSIHTFAGYLGGAITPGIMLFVVYLAGVQAALVVAGLLAVLAAVFLVSIPAGVEKPAATATKADKPAVAPVRLGQVLTPAILLLTAFFAFLSLSNGGLQNFGVPALSTGFGVGLTTANMALTAFLFASAGGVLAGGVIADRTMRHGEVAALAFALTAILVALVGFYRIDGPLLIGVLGLAGFLSGTIAPSRDMLVRKAAPAGAAGRVFGIVSTGFNIGGIIAPVLYGWLLDHRPAPWVFYLSAAFMAATVLLVLFTDRRTRAVATMAGKPSTDPAAA